MNINHLLFAAAILMAATAIAVGVARKLHLGTIVALLGVGVAVGPHSPVPLLTAGVDEMQAIGEIGVMLLMFVIGLGIQPTRLWSMRRLVFGLGAAQYAFATAAIFAFLFLVPGPTGFLWQSAIVASLALAMSSDAIAFPALQERHDVAAPHGQAAVAIDVFQSFMVVPVLALIPLLGAGTPGGRPVLEIVRLLEVAAAVAGVFALGQFLLPWALRLTARNLGPTGFPVVALAGVFFSGWWMESVGISMALGAFMIGVILSTTPFAEQIEAAVAPAKRVLLGVFFIAIGMAIDLKEVVALKFDLLLYLPALLLIKCVLVIILARIFGLGTRSAILTGLLMMPFDEIAYVMLASANANGLLRARDYAVGLSVISFSFIVSPLLINLGYRLTEPLRNVRAAIPAAPAGAATEDSVIVAGFGSVGRAICVMLERAKIPYTAFELDQERLAEAAIAKHNVHYGDIADPELMSTVGIARARLVIVTMGDNDARRRMIGSLRQFFPRVPAMTAVQYLAERDELRRIGAGEVVALSPEGALSFGGSILARLGVGDKQREAIVDSLKADDYAILRGATGSERI